MGLNKAASTIILGAITLSAFHRARLNDPSSPTNKFSWISALTMAILVRKLLKGPNKKFIKQAKEVAREVKEGETDFDEFDFVVVGGGTSGCVLAARLSEDPSVRVLLLEAGGSGEALLYTRIPVAYSKLFRTRHVFQFYTEPQASANGKKKFWPRGKMLGGCSSINAQMAQWGAPGDFDRWGNIIQDDAWKWDNFQQYFDKFGTYIPHPDFPDVDVKLKGSTGPVRFGYFSDVSQGSKDFIKACTNIGIPYSPDFNTSKGPLGVNKIMTFIDKTRTRVSSESAYLTKDVLARPNLKVVINATVTKVLTEKVGNEIRTVGVEFAKVKNGPRYRVRSKRDVILSAGAIHSPQILLLSGIGPSGELRKHQIPVVHDLPGVGDNLIDHPVVDLYFKNRHNNSPTYVQPHGLIDAAKLIGATLQYFLTRKGPMATNFGESAAFIRSDDPVLFPDVTEKLTDTTSAADSPDLEIFTTPLAYKDHGEYMFPMHTMAVHVVLLRPKSTGTIRLNSASPWDAPAMDPNYLSDREDVAKLARGVRLILNKITKQEPFALHFDHTEQSTLLDHATHLKSDAELEDLVRERVETLYHPTSTCKMAPLEQGGVVDSHLRVHGVKGLRVCDASIFPEIVSGHTAAAAFAVGEHLGDIIKAELAQEKRA